MNEHTTTRRRNWSAPRSRGMLSGIGLMILGAWGAIIPFVGPYFDYAYSPNSSWTWTAGRGYLEVLPGALAFLAGLGMVTTRHRATGSMFAWFGVLAGAWFVVGPLVAPTWDSNAVGVPVGGQRTVALEQIGIFFGLGAAIVLLAATALGRFSMNVPMAAAAPASARAVVPANAEAETAPAREPVRADEPAPTQQMEPAPMYSAPPMYGAPPDMTNGPLDKQGDQQREETGPRHHRRLFGRHNNHVAAH